jgi:DNA invertase Pin-like site-specific DNA recombinase
VYAAKSTEDLRGSIATQLDDCRAAIDREGGRRVIATEHEEVSAFKRSRGPALERAKRLAAEAAERDGHAELWVQHSDRLARGDGLTADHVAEVFFAMRRVGVRLRSVQDDANLEDAIRAVLIGERNHEDSARKAKATQAGKRRVAERGEWPGGIRPDGYRVLHDVDDRGRVTRSLERDPDRAPVIEMIWRLAVDGWSDRAIVLELDRRGHMTAPYKRGAQPRPFDANRVRQTLTSAVYAGLTVHRGEVVGAGTWPAYVSVADFQRIRATRSQRAGQQRSTPGPAPSYVLARVAVCGTCGAPMDVVTSRYRRKDSSRQRTYTCRAHRERPQDCAARPVDATVVDRAFVANLTSFLGDVEAWRDRLAGDRDAESARMAREVERAQADAADHARKAERLAAKYTELLDAGDDAGAAAVLDMVKARRADLERAERRLAAATDALRDIPSGEPVDALLDFFAGLRDELAGRVQGAGGDVRRLNATVRDFFDRVELTHVDDGVRILPVLGSAAAERILSDPDRWPHDVATVLPGGRRLSHGQAMDLDDIRAMEAIAAATQRGEGVDLTAEIGGPPAVVARGDTPPLRAIEAPARDPQSRW